MAFISKALLDKLEPLFTRQAKSRPNKAPSFWAAALYPSLLLKPTDKYTRQIYLRETTVSGVSAVLIIAFTMAAPFVCFWYLDSQLFSNPQFQSSFARKLFQDGFYWVIVEILFLFAFNYVLYLPRFYFWNRRATRLRANPVVEKGQPVR